MHLEHGFVASVGLFLLSIMACGPLLGPSSGDPCDPSSYPPRCTDGFLVECSPASDCAHHDCLGYGCSCYDYPHTSKTDCSAEAKRCVVDKDRAFCQ